MITPRAKSLALFALGVIVGAAALLLGRGDLRLGSQAPAPAQSTTTSLSEVARQIREGGLILHFRHAHRQKWDSVIAFDVFETATGVDSSVAPFRDAVCLSPQGIEEARMIGEVLRLANVPVGSIWSSPSCRAKQTAILAFGRIDGINVGLAHTPVTNDGNHAAFRDEVRRLFTTVPLGPGANAIVTAHGNTLENYPELFASGTEHLSKTLLLETGFYAIRRDDEGKLHILARFGDLGVLAASLVDLDPTALVDVAERVPALPVRDTAAVVPQTAP